MIEAFPAPVRPPLLAEVADQLSKLEQSSDETIVQAARLVDRALSNRSAARLNARAAQPLIEHLEAILTAQFASRRAMIAFHSKGLAIGNAIVGADDGEEFPYGPTGPCKFASAKPVEKPVAVAAA